MIWISKEFVFTVFTVCIVLFSVSMSRYSLLVTTIIYDLLSEGSVVDVEKMKNAKCELRTKFGHDSNYIKSH